MKFPKKEEEQEEGKWAWCQTSRMANKNSLINGKGERGHLILPPGYRPFLESHGDAQHLKKVFKRRPWRQKRAF
jgi:hypothetical protein